MKDGTDWDAFPDADPTEFRLANGNHIQVVFGTFWSKTRPFDFVRGDLPTKFYGVRIYSNEGTLSERRILQYEFRTPHDFTPDAVPRALDWLDAIVADRTVFEFDSLDDLVIALGEELNAISLNHDDMCTHFAAGWIEEREDAEIDEWFDHC
jgi:hypothetical protein